jgi:hypothetical protein
MCTFKLVFNGQPWNKWKWPQKWQLI